MQEIIDALDGLDSEDLDGCHTVSDLIYETYGCSTEKGKSIWENAWEMDDDAPFYVFSSIMTDLVIHGIDLPAHVSDLLYESIDAGLT